MHETKGEKVFSVINYILLFTFALICLAPFIHLIAQSFSSHRAIVSGEVTFWPIEWSLYPYKEILNDSTFIRSLFISILRTVVGTTVSVLFTCLLAYPLSKPYIKGRSLILFLIVFTMMFQGGMIPSFLVVRSMQLLDTFWAYIFPSMISAFNVIIFKNFFESVPDELEESARIDGCSNIGILFRVIIPVSMPVIATITLFYAVFHWNSYFDAVLFVNDRSLYPLQIYLRELIILDETNIALKDNIEKQLVANESLNAAALIVSTIPILLVFPYLQRYFVKGIMLGSIKG